MNNIIKFAARSRGKKPEASKFRFTVNWKNVTHIERMADNGCRVYFIGGNSITVDRTYEQVDDIVKKVWDTK